MFGTKESNSPNSSQMSSPTVSTATNRVSWVYRNSAHHVQISIRLPPPVRGNSFRTCPAVAMLWSSPSALGNMSVCATGTASPLWSSGRARQSPPPLRALRRFLPREPELTNLNRREGVESVIEAAESRLPLATAMDVLPVVHLFLGLSVTADGFSIHIRRESHDKGVAKPPQFRPSARHVEHCGRRRSHCSPDNAQVWQSV